MARTLTRIWAWVAGLSAGVLYGFGSAARLPVVGGLVLGAWGLAARRNRTLTVVGIAALAFAVGTIDAQWRSARGAHFAEMARGAPRCSFEATALESEGGLGTLATVRVLECDGGAAHAPGLAWIETAAPPGGAITGIGWLVPLGDDGFGRARRRFGAGAELAPIDVHVTPPDGGLSGLAYRIRDGLAAASAGVARDRAGLLVGLTTGDTRGLTATATDEFRAAGLSHLVAVSGQNVAMVLGAVALATRRLGARARSVLAVATIGLFVLVVGPQPSVLRAGAMAVIVVAAVGGGARVEPWHALGLALGAVIALRPAVLYSAGLHLSVAATAGLLLWARPLLLRLTRLPSWMALTLAATMSAQMAVVPLVASLFGEVSLVAPVANVLALPAVPPATVLGLCAAVAGTVSPELGALLARLAEPFVAWILLVAHVLGAAEWSAVDVPRWTGLAFGAAVAGIAVATASRRGDATLRSGR